MYVSLQEAKQANSNVKLVTKGGQSMVGVPQRVVSFCIS
jgi:hypothetical protein